LLVRCPFPSLEETFVYNGTSPTPRHPAHRERRRPPPFLYTFLSTPSQGVHFLFFSLLEEIFFTLQLFFVFSLYPDVIPGSYPQTEDGELHFFILGSLAPFLSKALPFFFSISFLLSLIWAAVMLEVDSPHPDLFSGPFYFTSLFPFGRATSTRHFLHLSPVLSFPLFSLPAAFMAEGYFVFFPLSFFSDPVRFEFLHPGRPNTMLFPNSFSPYPGEAFFPPFPPPLKGTRFEIPQPSTTCPCDSDLGFRNLLLFFFLFAQEKHCYVAFLCLLLFCCDNLPVRRSHHRLPEEIPVGLFVTPVCHLFFTSLVGCSISGFCSVDRGFPSTFKTPVIRVSRPSSAALAS